MKDFIKNKLNEELTKRNIKGEYFYQILHILFGDKINTEFINKHRKDIEITLINRAKENLDSKPTPDKINQWKQKIKEVLDFYLNGKFDIEDSDDIKDYNVKLFNNSLKNPIIINYIFGSDGLTYDIYHELGYNGVKKYIEKESKITFTPINNQDIIYKNLKYQPTDDKEDKIIKNHLLYYFLRRVFANIPSDKKLQFSDEQILEWLKTYTYKFIYEYANKFKEI